MSTDKPRSLLRLDYADAAEAYLRSLPPEHFRETTSQATQREITLESFDLLHARRPEVQFFNELLVQYPHGRAKRIRQVVPDNMVVVHPEPIDAIDSYDLPFQPVGLFWVLEYVSKVIRRKDYEDSFLQYERELKVPYYLLFYPDVLEVTLFRHTGRRYAAVRPNDSGRLDIPQLTLEAALLEDWVRFWFKGELLPLPAELERDLQETRRQLRQAEKRARQAEEQAERLRARLRELGIDPDAGPATGS
jgi:Uma2 family endonuclease